MGLIAESYARMMSALLPAGRLWRMLGGGLLPKVILACADELARVDARAAALLEEADPTTADELLPEYEADYEIEATGTKAQRRGRIVGQRVARPRVRPVDYQAALTPLLGDVVVLERSHAGAVALGDEREIYRFFIYRDPSLPGTYDVAGAQALVDKLAHSHTQGHVIESLDLIYDDPHSLYDRDLLGA